MGATYPAETETRRTAATLPLAARQECWRRLWSILLRPLADEERAALTTPATPPAEHQPTLPAATAEPPPAEVAR